MRFRHILFPVDFSERSRAVSPFVLSMARRHGARVTLLHVVEPPLPVYADMAGLIPNEFDYDEAKTAIWQRLQQIACAELPKVDTTCDVEIGLPAERITSCASRANADLIAMPTHGYGAFRRMLLGSITAKVLHDARVPVWTSAHAPEPSHRAHPQPRLILAALDLTPENRRVLQTALELARDAGAKLDIVHFAGEDEVDARQFEARSRELLNEIARDDMMTECGDAGVIIEASEAGEGVSGAVRRAALEKRADLVVTGRGSIQHNSLPRLSANSYAIIREAPCPVLSI
jgi:nucleotide-binding universal stress UspA family protein